MKKTFVFLFAVIAILNSCMVSEPEVARPQGTTLTFTASFESNNPTRTVLDGTHVLWEPEDAIWIWYGTSGRGFQNSLTEPAPTCDFSGTINLFGEPDGKTYFGAIYPFYMSSDQSDYSYYYDGEFGNLFVLGEQDAVEGSYDNFAFPSVARTLDTHLYFRNIAGGVILRFSEGCQDYSKVVFRANGLEPIASYEVYAQMVDFEDGEGEVPYVVSSDYNCPEVTLNAPEGGFKPGVDYYVSMLPCPLRYGFSIAFVGKDGKVAVKKYTGAQEIKRSVFGRTGILDTGLTWKDVGTFVENPALIERQWSIDLGEGTTYLFDIGHSAPGYAFVCPMDAPELTSDDIYAYTLKRNIFGEAILSMLEQGGLPYYYYDISAVSSTAMDAMEFYGYKTYQDGYPSELHFTPVASEVVPSYGGVWLDVDGVNYDIYISSDNKAMYNSFLEIASANGGSLPILYLNALGAASDYRRVDARGKVVVVNRGDITFEEKVTNAYNAGAIGVLIANTSDEVLYMSIGSATQIPSGLIYKTAGANLSGKTSVPCFRPTLAQLVGSLSD